MNKPAEELTVSWEAIRKHSYWNPPPPLCAGGMKEEAHQCEYLCTTCRRYYCDPCYHVHDCTL